MSGKPQIIELPPADGGAGAGPGGPDLPPEAEVELARWWASAPGAYLLAWEQQRLDARVNDLFGFHALQLGLDMVDGLRANRMPHRWLALESPAWALGAPPSRPPLDAGLSVLEDAEREVAVYAQAEALPFASQSLDLVVMPHTLEWTRDPHQALREVERVLMPEGRVVIVGLNPHSLWGARQRLGRLRQTLGGGAPLFMPRAGEFIGDRRVRDWLKLLGFEVERCEFGCWRPPIRNAAWLRSWAWTDHHLARWLPRLGAAYVLQAVKRVRGMRLVGLSRKQVAAASAAPAVVAPRRHHRAPHADEERS